MGHNNIRNGHVTKNYIVDIVNHPHGYLIDPILTLLSLLIFKALKYTPVEIQLCCF